MSTTTHSIIELLTNQTRELNFYNCVQLPLNNFRISSIGSFFHIMKLALGTGILALPNAFNHAGVLFGSVMIFAVASMYIHCAWILVWRGNLKLKSNLQISIVQIATSHKICRISKTPVLMYSGTAEKVFEHGTPWAKRHSKAAKNFVTYLLMFGSLLSSCVYIVFIANTFHGLCNVHFGWNWNVRIYILFVMVPVLLIGQIRTLKYLVPFSGAGVALILIVFGIVLYHIFKEPFTISNKPLIVSYEKWPIFFR